MKTVNAYYSAALLKYAAQQGVMLETRQLEKRVELESQDRLWQWLEQQIGRDLGIGFGRQLQPSDLGTFGHLLVSVNTLGDALAKLQQFYPLVGEGGSLDISHSHHQQLREISICYHPYYHQAREVRIEAVLVSILTLARQITYGAVPFTCIELDYTPRPAIVTLLTEFSGVEVRTLRATNSLHLQADALSLPLHHANPAVAQSIIPILSADLAALSDLSPADKVRRLLERQPQLDRAAVATRMHVSERTLCRQLKPQGLTFAELRQRILQDIADQGLKANESVNAIAERLGYSDASAFVKAYKRWTGRTPKQTIV